MVVRIQMLKKVLSYFMIIAVLGGGSWAWAGASKVWKERAVVKASIGPGSDAKILFEAMRFKSNIDQGYEFKTFKTTDSRLLVQCSRSLVQGVSIHECLFAVNTNEVSRAETTVFRDHNYWRLNFDSEVDAEALYDSLNLVERQGRSGMSKLFKTSDQRVEILCTKSKLPFGPSHGCSIALELK